MRHKRFGVIPIGKEYEERYGESKMEIYIFENVLKGRIYNSGVYLENEPKLLEQALDFLKSLKPTKTINNIINYYTQLDNKFNTADLKKEIIQLEKSALKDNVELSLNVEDYGAYPYLILDSIVVNEHMRNQGLGTKYMKKLTKLSDKYKIYLVLNVSDCFGSNLTKLRWFYRNFGFKNNTTIGIPYEMIYGKKEE